MALKGKGKAKSSGGDFDNTNRGVLFPNDKGDNESRPDYTGKINVDGVDKRLAAWVATSDKIEGGSYLRLTVSEFQQGE